MNENLLHRSNGKRQFEVVSEGTVGGIDVRTRERRRRNTNYTYSYDGYNQRPIREVNCTVRIAKDASDCIFAFRKLT